MPIQGVSHNPGPNEYFLSFSNYTLITRWRMERVLMSGYNFCDSVFLLTAVNNSSFGVKYFTCWVISLAPNAYFLKDSENMWRQHSVKKKITFSEALKLFLYQIDMLNKFSNWHISYTLTHMHTTHMHSTHTHSAEVLISKGREHCWLAASETCSSPVCTSDNGLGTSELHLTYFFSLPSCSRVEARYF